MDNLKCIALFICAAVFSAAAMAEDYVRDGRPCLSGICVGDEISTLAGIKWQAASFQGKPISLKTTNADVKSLLNNFAPSAAAAVAAAAPYLLFNVFDGQAIPKLANVKGFCNPHGLTGTFISDSGHNTEVEINVVPGADPSSQSLQVIRIVRIFPSSGYTSAQMSELSKQLEERYRGVRKGSPRGTEPAWSFDTVFGYMLILWAPIVYGTQVGDQLMAYPGCGKSLKID